MTPPINAINSNQLYILILIVIVLLLWLWGVVIDKIKVVVVVKDTPITSKYCLYLVDLQLLITP